jgi:hypothetical protein
MKQIAKTYIFKSSSGDATYQTLLYQDGSTSCDCPGWTRRVQPDGSRTCKHTRVVSAGMGYTALRVIDGAGNSAPLPTPTPMMKSKRKSAEPEPEQKTRRFIFD